MAAICSTVRLSRKSRTLNGSSNVVNGLMILLSWTAAGKLTTGKPMLLLTTFFIESEKRLIALIKSLISSRVMGLRLGVGWGGV